MSGFTQLQKKSLISGICQAVIIVGIIMTIFFGLHKITGDWEVMVVDSQLALFFIMNNYLKSGNVFRNLTFDFSRKRFFKNCLLGCFGGSIVYALCRSTVHAAFFKEYVEMFRDGTDRTVAMYHAVPFIELFLSNLMMFMAISLLLMWDMAKEAPFIVSWFGREGEMSLQMSVRHQQFKNRKTLLWRIWKVLRKVIAFIVTIVGIVGVAAIYEFQMLHGIGSRMLILGIEVAIVALFGFLAKRRYKPEYM